MKSGTNLRVLEREPKNTFRAVLVCADDAGVKNGMEICRLLLTTLDHALPFHVQIWPFNFFQNGNLDPEAVGDAIAADVIIVATDQRNDLPSAIKEWFAAWVPQKIAQTSILIGLFHCPGGSVPSPAFDYLKNAAIDADMDFLARQSFVEANRPAPAPPHEPPGVSPAPEGWGLND